MKQNQFEVATNITSSFVFGYQGSGQVWFFSVKRPLHYASVCRGHSKGRHLLRWHRVPLSEGAGIKSFEALLGFADPELASASVPQ